MPIVNCQYLLRSAPWMPPCRTLNRMCGLPGTEMMFGGVGGQVLYHPESGPWTVELLALMYAWHSRHHVSHITHLRARENW